MAGAIFNPARLEPVLQRLWSEPHDWQHTCLDFVTAAIRAAWGVEIGLSVNSAKGIAALYRRLGASDMAGAVTAVLGQPFDRRLARHGDIVDAGFALGMCLGNRAAVREGLVPMRETRLAWGGAAWARF